MIEFFNHKKDTAVIKNEMTSTIERLLSILAEMIIQWILFVLA